MTAQLAEKATPGVIPAIRIYQPFLNDEQKAQLNADAIAFDISFNTANDSREYELFKALQKKEADANPLDFWGLVSSKFELKAPISFAAFRQEAEAAMLSGSDCYVINPMIGHTAIYLNAKEHAKMGGHPSLGFAFDMLQTLGCQVDAPQNYRQFFFCNYVVGNARFWATYFGFCDMILGRFDKEVELGTEIGKLYAGSAQYFRDDSAGIRPFLIERLLGYFVQMAGTRGLKVAVHRPDLTEYEQKFGLRLGRALHRLFEAKEASISAGDQQGFQAWHNARQPLLHNPGAVWLLDDPPNWMAL